MSLTIITGNMFSGKTTELIRHIKKFRIIGKKLLVINSTKDTRCSNHVLRTHDFDMFACVKTNDLTDVDWSNADVIAIDECQFFYGLRVFVEKLLKHDKIVVLAGLDGDYMQRPFGEISHCFPLADTVIKLSALCMVCLDGTPGPFTQRVVNNQDLELVGDKDMYRAVCRKHLD